jgi:type IV pilus assembly protein PilC
MIYPAIIVFAVFVIGILMLIFVVPTLAATFASFGSKLPFATQVILDMSNFMRNNFIVVLIGLIVIVTAAMTFFRSHAGGVTVLFCALHMPVIGELTRETFSARAARTLSSLLGSGVEMLTALSITREVVGDNVFGAVVKQAEDKVQKGEQLSVSFIEHPKLYPILFSDMISVGEETGKVSDMLGQIAEYYENDVEDRTKDLSTIIEPLLMLFIGAFVGVFAVAMIAPIYSLSSSIG